MWIPGQSVITDLGRFRHCVPKTLDGKKAEAKFDEFIKDSKSGKMDKYQGPSLLPPKISKSFLKHP